MYNSLSNSGSRFLKTHHLSIIFIATLLSLFSLNGFAQEKIYYGDNQSIKSRNFDGSGEQTLFTGSTLLLDLAVDMANGKLYVFDFVTATGYLRRMNLDGSGVENVITGINMNSVVLDPANGKIYWIDSNNKKIQRANLNGSGIEDLVTGVTGILKLDLGMEN